MKKEFEGNLWPLHVRFNVHNCTVLNNANEIIYMYHDELRMRWSDHAKDGFIKDEYCS
jgi:hypothetical protein